MLLDLLCTVHTHTHTYTRSISLHMLYVLRNVYISNAIQLNDRVYNLFFHFFFVVVVAFRLSFQFIHRLSISFPLSLCICLCHICYGCWRVINSIISLILFGEDVVCCYCRCCCCTFTSGHIDIHTHTHQLSPNPNVSAPTNYMVYISCFFIFHLFRSFRFVLHKEWVF